MIPTRTGHARREESPYLRRASGPVSPLRECIKDRLRREDRVADVLFEGVDDLFEGQA